MSLRTTARVVGLMAALLTVILIVLASLPGTQAKNEAKGKKYALLVGVSKYDSGNFAELNFSDNDADKMEIALENAGFDSIRVLTSKRGEKNKKDAPNTANIQSELKTLLAKKTKHDTVLIGLAGHGMQLEVRDPVGNDTPKQYSYFCPSDASLQDPSFTTGKSDQLILLDDLFDQMGKSDAGHRVALIDACRSDATAKGSRRARLDTARVTIPDKVSALFSCGRGQLALETKELEHGVFFYHVIKGLQGEAENRKGVVTLDSLADYVKQEVPAYVKTHFGKKGARQDPASLGGNLEGATILVPRRDEQKMLVVEDKSKGFKMEFVQISATGKDGFTMGSTKAEQDAAIAEHEKQFNNEALDASLIDIYRSESPQHKVVLNKPYYLGKFEVTQGQWKALMNNGNPSYWSRDGDGKDVLADVNDADLDNFPVECVSWNDVQDFLNALAKLPGAKVKFRLPTEAEWEHACRAGDGLGNPFHFAKSTSSLSHKDANFHSVYPYGGGKGGEPLGRTCKVGSYPANRFGLHDLHGNVYEWCHDAYDAKAYQAKGRIDPFVSGDADAQRVFRSSCYYSHSVYCRAAFRYPQVPSLRDPGLGFRVVAIPHE